ncbi:UAA transporter [Coprinopsis marcescibilis]|uniref:UAA transporter n=1 Tax=Coprinopsis marcescibilis TaxID=230819 RepID=A0A5C3KJF8_COPMA|nr:UAA transporter [Coprinopsis marcescibilis]
MLFITLTSLPSFLYFPEGSLVPSLLPRTVPLKQWIIQVIVLVAGSLLNNWAFAYKVPLPILIVFRSAGLPVSLLFGFVFLKRRYGVIQTLSVAIVSLGVIFAALSGTDVTSSGLQLTRTPEELQLYLTGIAMLTGSLICTATLGLYQEKTYTKYGPVWREGLFYTHLLSLPSFVFLGSDIKQGLLSLSKGNAGWLPYIVLLANLVSQSACVAGVNRLSSQVSQVSTNIALTVRKAISLCLSVWWFGNAWNYQLGSGAAMVFFGSLLYTTCK